MKTDKLTINDIIEYVNDNIKNFSKSTVIAVEPCKNLAALTKKHFKTYSNWIKWWGFFKKNREWYLFWA